MIRQYEVQPDDRIDRRRKAAIVELSVEALLSMLMAPEGMNIADISLNRRGNISLTVTHPALKAVDEGSDLPILYPQYETLDLTVSAGWDLDEE